ncbi:MAG: cell envelope integrity protein CreD [Hyphomonadaceae bacterium]|nr:cell envelope integrity protein CreD [Hyphomonadaceae bacterium]
MADLARMPTRSVGLKFLLVCILAVLMALPAFAVFGLIYDRTSRVDEAVREVGQRFGGQQTFTGPILAAPFRQVIPAPPATPDNPRPTPTVNNGWYVVFAKTGDGVADIDTDVKARGSGGLFKVRTYTAEVAFSGAFDLEGEPGAAPDGAVIDWTKAVMLIGVTDPRGAAAPASLKVGDVTIPLEPGSAYAAVFPNFQAAAINSFPGRPMAEPGPGQWLVAPVGDIARPGAAFDVKTTLKFTGVESVSLIAFARDTDLRIKGDWEDVGYFGGFPRKEDAAAPAGGFDGRWTVPFIARNLAESGDAATLANLANLNVQVRLIDPANPYQSVTRALKYALMFLGVVFLAYFLMESTSERRVHPAQYILVGLAQLIFYLLLLSIAERIGFDVAFLIAAAATVTLIGAYAGAVFASARRGIIAFLAFAVLYALIYLLMRLEDYALLAGSIAAFVTIAAVMWFTRNLDWYGLTRPEDGRRG